MRKFLKGISFYVLIFIIIIFFAQIFSNTGEGKTKLSYTQFISEVESKRIRGEIYVSDLGVTSVITGKLSDGKKFETTVPSVQFNQLAQDYAERGSLNIIYEKPQQTSVWLSILPSAALFVLLIVFFFIFTQQTQGGGNRVMSFGKSKAKL
ncbi:MAG: cell division protein FtsH, partial [Lutispora sp.]|nr:cell division protein FtsH [Lutispora sp.]